MSKHLKPLPVPVILAAIDGDGEALATVVNHYRHYIRTLATKKLKDEYDNEYLYVDEDMCRCLEAKLVYSIATSFKVRAE